MNNKTLNKIVNNLKELLENMSDSELISIWNEYQSNINGDSYIYDMDDFDEIMSGYKPWEIARCCFYSGKFCPANSYFWFNGYGNAESSDYPIDRIYIDDMIDYIIENNDSLYNDDVQEILDEFEKDGE